MPPQSKQQQGSVERRGVPEFASYEQMAKVPVNGGWLWRRGPLARLIWFLSFAAILKVVTAVSNSPFLAAYGTYILVVFAVGALVVILWRHFHRDPTEGVGIKLN